MNFSATTFQLEIMTITGVPEFDYFFTLSFVMGAVMFVAAAPLRLFMNRWM